MPEQKQQELTEVAQALDPILLFQQIEQLQQAVFRCAVNCSSFVPSIPPVPIHLFSVEGCTTGNVHGEVSVPDPAEVVHTQYREQEPSKRVLGWQRTRKDPFEGEWEQVLSWLHANPERSSGDIFRELQRRSPGRYQLLQIRTHKPRYAENPSSPALEKCEEQWQVEVMRGPSPRQLNKPPRKIFGEAMHI